MATTTKSTTRKSSTKAKAKAAPKKKTAAVKSTAKKTVTKKVPAKKTAVSSPVKTEVKVAKKNTKEPTPFERLRSMHLTSALVYALFAGLVGVFVKTASVAVSLPIMSRDQFAGTGNVTLGAANEVLYSIQPKYMLVFSLVFAAIAGLLFATKLQKPYEKAVSGRVSGFRWIAVGLSSAATLSYVYLLAGLTNLWVLKFGALLIIVTSLFAWVAERDNVGARAPRWLAYIISLFTGVAAWLPVIGTFIGTSVYGGERFSWIVYATATAALLGFTGFAITQYRQLRESGRQKDFVYIEASYYQIDLFAKFAIVLFALIAFK